MAHFIPPLFKSLSAALLFTSVLGSGALAQSLPDIAPERIASDVERRYDSRTGAAEYVAGSFDPFEADESLAGSVSLRSGGPAITIDGRSVSGGAFLDISALYTAGSADSYDIRGLERATFLSGAPASIIRHESKTLDCSRTSREVAYDDGYYGGAPYGYVAGLYRLYPRYRGHRNFGWSRGYWRRGRIGIARGAWGPRSQNIDSGFSSNRQNSQSARDARRRDRTRGASDTARRRQRDNESGTWRRDRVNSEDRARRQQDRSQSRDARRASREADRRTRLSTESDMIQRNRDRETQRRVRNQDTGNAERRRNRQADRAGRQRDGDATATQRTPRADRAARRSQREAARAQTPKPRTEPKPSSRPAPRSTSRPTSRPSRPASRPARPSVDRAVDRTFKSQNRTWQRGNKQRNFFPLLGAGGYARTDVYVSNSCVKEESLSVHIPQERLEAARFDGFTILLIDNAGREVPVFVPPNYVEGFRQAAGPRVATAPAYAPPMYNPAPSYQVPRSSREPIIYGDPGYPQPGQ